MDLLLVARQLHPYVSGSPAAVRVAQLAKAYRLLGHQVTIAVPREPEFEAQGVLAARRLSPLVAGDGREILLFQAELPSGAKLALLDMGGDFVEGVVALARERAEADQPFDVVHSFGDTGAGLHAKLHEALGSDATTVHSPLPGEASPAEATGEIFFSQSQGFEASGRRLSIFGGLDVAVDNPSSDSTLPFRYDPEAFQNKGRVKSATLIELGLEVRPERPVFVVFDRGEFDGILEALVDIVRQGVAVVLVTDRILADYQKAPIDALSGSVVLVGTRRFGTAEVTERRLLAAADFCLDADAHSTTAEGLLRAQRYGAIPVALARGANREAVVDVDAELLSGSGLLFEVASARGFVAAVGRAVAAYSHPDFTKLLRRTLRQDFAWDRAARRHLQFYKTLVARQFSNVEG